MISYGRKAYKKARYKRWRSRMAKSFLRKHPEWVREHPELAAKKVY